MLLFFVICQKGARGALDATNVIVIDCFCTKNVIQNENIKTVELVGGVFGANCRIVKTQRSGENRSKNKCIRLTVAYISDNHMSLFTYVVHKKHQCRTALSHFMEQLKIRQFCIVLNISA